MLKGAIDILINDATVADLVGNNTAGDKVKVYPGICPQPEHDPFIVLRITSKTDYDPCKGVPATTFEATFDVYIYTKNYEDGDDIANAVKDALDLVSGTYNEVVFDEIRYQDMNDGFEDKYALFTKTVTFNAIVNES